MCVADELTLYVYLNFNISYLLSNNEFREDYNAPYRHEVLLDLDFYDHEVD